MADINATDLTPETAATLDGSEEFVMFDNVEGKRGELDTVGDYIVQHCDADGNGNTAAQLAGGAQTDATAALGKIGDLASLTTTDKSTLVKAINEVDSHADSAQADATSAGTNASSALSKIGNLSSLDTTNKTDLVSAVNEVKGQADDNTTALQTKAEVDGAYEAMTVGNAEQLVSNIRVTDTDPYLFRTAGGSLEIGDREYPTLVGASVAVNQQCEKPDAGTAVSQTVTFVSDGNGYCTANGTADGGTAAWNTQKNTTNITKDHVYLLKGCPKGGSESTYRVWVNSRSAFPIGYRLFDTGNGAIGKAAASESGYKVQAQILNGVSVNNLKFYGNLIDLTQMLGTTIADYIYTLEQGTAGAGVAFCKKYGIGVGYTAYNAGTLQSTTPTKHTTVGFNQWDEETDIGDIDGITGAYKTGDYLRTKNLIPVLPSTAYYIKIPSTIVLYEYDADRNGIVNNGNYAYHYISTSGIYTTDARTRYIAFRNDIYNPSQTYNHDICINLHWDGERDGEYEPYTKHEYDLGNDTLRGIFELNNGELKANGDVKTADGTIQRKFGQLDLGTKTWYYNTTSAIGPYFYCYIAGTSTPPIKREGDYWNTIYSAICPKYVTVARVADTFIDKTITFDGDATVVGQIQIKDSAYTDAAAFKTAMSGVYLVYELATPTEEEGTAFQSPQIVSNWGTEEYIEANGIVVGHSTEYPQDLKAKVESAPNNPSADGDYIVKRENGENAYVPLVIPQELPNAPSGDGTYNLKCTVADGTAVYSWEAE